MNPDARCCGLPRVLARLTEAVWLEACRGSSSTATAAAVARKRASRRDFILVQKIEVATSLLFDAMYRERQEKQRELQLNSSGRQAVFRVLISFKNF